MDKSIPFCIRETKKHYSNKINSILSGSDWLEEYAIANHIIWIGALEYENA